VAGLLLPRPGRMKHPSLGSKQVNTRGPSGYKSRTVRDLRQYCPDWSPGQSVVQIYKNTQSLSKTSLTLADRPPLTSGPSAYNSGTGPKLPSSGHDCGRSGPKARTVRSAIEQSVHANGQTLDPSGGSRTVRPQGPDSPRDHNFAIFKQAFE
jgi:hypothetical protein